MTPEESFEKNVGDDKLFPNHTDKDIWFSGYTQCQKDMADTIKQETLEEAAERLAYDSTEENKGFPSMKRFIEGVKWQQEMAKIQKYTEEDIKNAINVGISAEAGDYPKGWSFDCGISLEDYFINSLNKK